MKRHMISGRVFTEGKGPTSMCGKDIPMTDLVIEFTVCDCITCLNSMKSSLRSHSSNFASYYNEIDNHIKKVKEERKINKFRKDLDSIL